MSRETSEPQLPYETQLASGLPRAKELVKSLIAWSALPLGSVIRVATREPAIALTFDDGPDPEDTPRVLEVLERYGARGTFFMVGKSARRHPEVVARAVSAGHAVANHSWDHLSFRRIRGSYRRAELRWCGEALAPHGAPALPPAVRRPEPGLAAGRPALRLSRGVLGRGRRGLAGRPRGAPGAARDAAAAARQHRALPRHALHHHGRALPRPRPHAAGARDPARAGSPEHYRFVTVPELLRLGRPVRWHHYQRLPLDFHRQLD